jgi:hypothetical protein
LTTVGAERLAPIMLSAGRRAGLLEWTRSSSELFFAMFQSESAQLGNVQSEMATAMTWC